MAAVSKHEGASFLILRDARRRVRSLLDVFDVRAPQDEAFETRARAFEVCRTSSACALLRMRTSIASFTAHDVKQPSSFSRRVGVRGLRLLLRSRRMRVGGAPRDVRVQRHPLGVHMTRHARRLRGALRPMTQQDTSRNNVTISIPDRGSVPIVSETEIDPMKTALSLMLALTHRAAARAEAAGGP